MAEPKYVGEMKSTLATLIERSENTYKLCEKMEQHQAIQDDKVDGHEVEIAEIKTTIYGKGGNNGLVKAVSILRGRIWKVTIIILGSGGIAALVNNLIGG